MSRHNELQMIAYLGQQLAKAEADLAAANRDLSAEIDAHKAHMVAMGMMQARLALISASAEVLVSRVAAASVNLVCTQDPKISAAARRLEAENSRRAINLAIQDYRTSVGVKP